jgi:hypothetical protein
MAAVRGTFAVVHRLRSGRLRLSWLLGGRRGMVHRLRWLLRGGLCGVHRIGCVRRCLCSVVFGSVVATRKRLAPTQMDAMIILHPFRSMLPRRSLDGVVGHSMYVQSLQRAVTVDLDPYMGMQPR